MLTILLVTCYLSTFKYKIIEAMKISMDSKHMFLYKQICMYVYICIYMYIVLVKLEENENQNLKTMKTINMKQFYVLKIKEGNN